MRIGIDGRYIQDHFPGIGRYTYNLIKELANVVPEVDWAVLHNPRVLNTRHEVAGLGRYPKVELIETDVPTLSVKEQYRLPSLTRRSSLDLLHSPYYIKPYWLPCPSVVTIHDVIPIIYPQHLPSPWTSWIFRVTASLAARRAKRVIAVSESTRKDLNRLFGIPFEKIAVTPEAADERFRPVGEKEVEDVRCRYGLPEKYVLYVGINKPHKNLVHLIQVFGTLELDASLVLAGREDRRYPETHQEAERLGLGERVIFLGEVVDDHLPALYSGATVFAFPSLYEGFGLPVLEAMACGAPVICSNTSSLPEIVGDAAITLDPLDQESWTAAMGELIEKETLQEEMQEKGLQRARKYSWKETARRTWEVYQDVVKV